MQSKHTLLTNNTQLTNPKKQSTEQHHHTNCSLCSLPKQQLLGLICNHDICIDCAANHYFANNLFTSSTNSTANHRQHIKNTQTNSSIYWCQICYQATIIDKDSIQLMALHIDKMKASNKMSQKQQYILNKKQKYIDKNKNTKRKMSIDQQSISYAFSCQKLDNHNYYETDKNITKNKNKLRDSKQKYHEKKSRSSSKNIKNIVRKPNDNQIIGDTATSAKYNQNLSNQFDDYFQLVTSHNIKSSHTLCSSDRNKQLLYPNNNNKNNTNTNNTKNNNRLTSKQSPYYHKQKNPKTSKQILTSSLNSLNKYPCSLHQDQYLTYYCFSCYQPLCAQCAITGPHKTHQINSIKRNPMKLQEVFCEIMEQAHYYRQVLNQYLEKLAGIVSGYRQAYNGNEKMIRLKFQKLHHILTQKQTQLLTQLKSTCTSQLTQLKLANTQYSSIIKQMDSSAKTIKNIFKQQISQWDIYTLEKQKQILQNITKSTLKNYYQSRKILQKNSNGNRNSAKSFNNNNIMKMSKMKMKNIDCSLIWEAIDVIEQLVLKFRVEIKENEANQ